MGEVFQLRRPQLILSLCDRTGNWSRPYEENGYEVIRLDLEHGDDVRLFQKPKAQVHGILAAPPCTVFAQSGARWPRTEGGDARGPVDRRRVPADRRRVPAIMVGAREPRREAVEVPFIPPRREPVEATEGSKMHRVAPGPLTHDPALQALRLLHGGAEMNEYQPPIRTLDVCGTCGIVLPQKLWSGARVVAGAICAHRNTVAMRLALPSRETGDTK